MNKSFLTLSTVFFTLLFSFPAFAQQSQSRPYGNRGYNSGYRSYGNYSRFGAAYRNEVGASASFGEISSANSTTVINLSSSYKNMVTRNSAFGGILDIATLNGNGNSNTYFGIWGTYSYYFDTNWNTVNSFFMEGAIGFADTGLANQGHSDVIKSDRQFSWMALIGKNFPIFDKVRFTPKAGVQKIGSTDLAILIIPVNLTLAF
jgi:hypothetical protein